MNGVDTDTLRQWLAGAEELALLDVREHGQFGQGHLFFAVPLPYSRFELDLPALAPNPNVRTVLCDGGDGVAKRAAERAGAMGYGNVQVLEGGVVAWAGAGHTLYAGVNVPSKSFGELVEHTLGTPRINAGELRAMADMGENMVIVDGRPFEEYGKMNIPGGICCPNGEMALRIADIAPDPETRIVVNCAGRTRSIIGAQSLIDLGIPNPVCALENGTQGWFLAGYELERGASRRYPDQPGQDGLDTPRARTRALAEARGATFIAPEELEAWLKDETRTTYLFDVRTREEFEADGAPGAAHAPGGQLVQATDRWVGVRGARIVLIDGEGVRAPMIASWLAQLGHEAHVLEGGVAALGKVTVPPPFAPERPAVADAVTAKELAGLMKREAVRLIDLRPSMCYREGHIEGAVWSIRPRIASAAPDASLPVVLVAGDPGAAALAALELAEADIDVKGRLDGEPGAWRAAGLDVVSTPGAPPDDACIDFLFFTHGRHEGGAGHARAYLEWETGLVDKLDEQERGAFRITPAPS